MSLLHISRNYLVLLLCLGLLGTAHLARPLPASAQQVVYVDNGHPAASDSNPATREAPLLTISEGVRRGIESREAGFGTQIIVEEGVYREAIDLRGLSPEGTSAPVVIEGSGNVVVSGSEVWNQGWKRTTGSVYRHHWPFDWGKTAIPDAWQSAKPFLSHENGDLVQRREIVFFKGQVLRQVLRKSELTDFKRSFFVSERRDKVFIRLPKRARPGGGRVEVATRPHLLTIDGTENVTIRNLVFQQANSPLDTQAALIKDSSNVSIAESVFRLNNWRGLEILNSEAIAVTHSKFNKNGIGGLGAKKVRGLLVENVEASKNNWRGWWAEFTVWTVGQKFHSLRDSVFRNYRATGNKSHGLWLDFDNSGVLVTGATLKNNYGHGMFFDGNQGPITFERSTSCNNRNGIFAASSANVTVQDNIVFNNEVFGFYLHGNFAGTRRIRDQYTGEVRYVKSVDWTLTQNKIVNRRASQFLVGTVLSTERWRDFTSTLNSNSNLWYNPGRPKPFQIVRGTGDRYRRVFVDFKGWKSNTGQDANSRYARPAGFKNLC